MARNSAVAIAVIISSSLFCSIQGQYPPSYKKQNFEDLVGLECSPPFGFLRRTCGTEILIEETVMPAPIYLYGPNTCRITQVAQRNELEYVYRRFCDWVFDHVQYNYVWRCQVVCEPTYTCTDRNQTLERFFFECCEGFQVRPHQPISHYDYLLSRFFVPIPTDPVGCPRAVGDRILDCLERLQLTEFINLANQSALFSMVNNPNGSEFTVLAPTNEAFESMSDLVDSIDLETFVGHHLIGRSVTELDLEFDQRFQSLANTTLHSTTVVFGDRVLHKYSPGYFNKNNPGNLIRYTMIRFIGGARVVNADACITEGVTLQVIDRVLVPETETIASILMQNPSLSMFTEALRFARVLDFLDKEDVSRTVFVPNNTVFNAQIPPDLFICLTSYMRFPLNELSLHHLVQGTEYTTSLSLRQFTYTLQSNPILLETDSEGTITLLTSPPATITVPNIPASNGVIHIIDGVLIPPNFDYGGCIEFVPTTPPPTTAPPTTAPPPTSNSTSNSTEALRDLLLLFPGSDLFDLEENP